MANMRMSNNKNRLAGEARTRARSDWERDAPFKLQELKNTGALDVAQTQGKSALDKQGLANVGALDKQGLVNTGALDERKLANIGALDKQGLVNIGNMDQQGLANTGRMNVQNAADSSQMSRLGITDASNRYKTNLQSATDIATQQTRVNALAEEGRLNRLATLENPKYMSYQTGSDEFKNPIYAMENVNTPARRAMGKNMGSMNKDQKAYFINTMIRDNDATRGQLGYISTKKKDNKKPTGSSIVNSRFGHATGLKNLDRYGQGIIEAQKAIYNRGIKPAINYFSEEVQ